MNQTSPPNNHPLGPSPEPATPIRQSVARIAIIYFAVFLASLFVMCSCPGIFAVMVICAIVGFVAGSRVQRICSSGLLPIAIVGLVFQIREVRRTHERLRHAMELYQQRNKRQ